MKKRIAAVFAGFTAFCILNSCVGGTGAGNPTNIAGLTGGPAAISLQAFSSYGQPPRKSHAGSPAAKRAFADSQIIMVDQGGTLFHAQEARLNVRQIRITLPEGVSCSDIDFELKAPALCGQDKIVLDGPFVFDLLTGQAVPPIDTLMLPVGSYTRMELLLEAGVSVDIPVNTLPIPQRYTLEMKGIFTYDSVENRAFSMLLNLNVLLPLSFNSGIDVMKDGVRLFKVDFDIHHLLQATDIAFCLNNQGVSFDSTGRLVLETSRFRGACLDIGGIIQRNFDDIPIRMNGLPVDTIEQ